MNILVSACLLGTCCRYDGRASNKIDISALKGKCHLIPVCPEQLGGLPTPRTPSERVGDRIVSRKGENVTAWFHHGAEETLKIAQAFPCKAALLKERSPSCGTKTIYDGSFTGKKISGIGVTAELLHANGIAIFSEEEIDALAEWIDNHK